MVGAVVGSGQSPRQLDVVAYYIGLEVGSLGRCLHLGIALGLKVGA